MTTFGRELSIDAQIIMAAARGLSPEDISRELDGVLSPARVMVRTRELLKSGDWLTQREQEQALLFTLRNRIHELQRHNDLDSIKLQAGLIKEVLAQIDRRSKATTQDLTTYNRNVGQQLGRVVDLALTYMKGAFREQINPDKWDDTVQEAVLIASQEIEKKQVESE